MFEVELYLKNRNYLDIKVKLLKLIKANIIHLPLSRTASQGCFYCPT